jgi:PKD repeat protein
MNGEFSTDANLSHRFRIAGAFSVKLTVTDDRGGKAFSTIVITVWKGKTKWTAAWVAAVSCSKVVKWFMAPVAAISLQGGWLDVVSRHKVAAAPMILKLPARNGGGGATGISSQLIASACGSLYLTHSGADIL